jgi:hypothetical protein
MKEIQLTKGKVALVDDGDFERVNALKWQAFKNYQTWYARRNEGSTPRRNVRMHQYILGVRGKTSQIDHRDGNGLNNQRSNLRIATAMQNQSNRGPQRNNTSGFKGVCKRYGKWRAQIKYKGEKISLGTYPDPAEAARAYDRKARELFGEFAWQNFPQENSNAQQ